MIRATVKVLGIALVALSAQRVSIAAIAVEYRTHVSNRGWTEWAGGGDTSGVRGEQIEALRIKLNDSQCNVVYQVHISDQGWTGWKKNGDEAGTTGKKRGVEAVRIKLDGCEESIGYRIYVKGRGWSGWERDGGTAGTIGQATSIEGLQIRIGMNRGRWSREDNGDRWSEESDARRARISYQAHVSNEGWTSYLEPGRVAGAPGKQLEALRIRAEGLPGKITYQVHVADQGWTNWKQEGEEAGTTGKRRAIEAVRIRLESAPGWSVRYRVFVRRQGWTSWTRDGDMAGTTGQAKPLEAVQIELLQSGNSWDKQREELKRDRRVGRDDDF